MNLVLGSQHSSLFPSQRLDLETIWIQSPELFSHLTDEDQRAVYFFEKSRLNIALDDLNTYQKIKRKKKESN